MNGEQISMFDAAFVAGEPDLPRPSAEIIAFPVDRHLVFVRQTARQLERRQGVAAERWWKTECNRLYGRLQVQGLCHADIVAEIDRFAVAVQVEMQRAAWALWRSGRPGGDAA